MADPVDPKTEEILEQTSVEELDMETPSGMSLNNPDKGAYKPIYTPPPAESNPSIKPLSESPRADRPAETPDWLAEPTTPVQSVETVQGGAESFEDILAMPREERFQAIDRMTREQVEEYNKWRLSQVSPQQEAVPRSTTEDTRNLSEAQVELMNRRKILEERAKTDPNARRRLEQLDQTTSAAQKGY